MDMPWWFWNVFRDVRTQLRKCSDLVVKTWEQIRLSWIEVPSSYFKSKPHVKLALEMH